MESNLRAKLFGPKECILHLTFEGLAYGCLDTYSEYLRLNLIAFRESM